MNCMCFCRLGWSRGLCLSKGICWVLLLSWETPCTHCKGQGEPISYIYWSECQGRNPVQHWTHQCQCSYVGCVPREGSYPTNCGRPCKLHGVEGWGFPGMGGRMGFSLSRGWWVKEGPSRGKKPNMNFQLRKSPYPCTTVLMLWSAKQFISFSCWKLKCWKKRFQSDRHLLNYILLKVWSKVSANRRLLKWETAALGSGRKEW